MTQERTLSIIKPDAVGKNHIGAIISRFEKGGLTVVAAKMIHLTPPTSKRFLRCTQRTPFLQRPCTIYQLRPSTRYVP
jgi:nucleoside-diphosphate kinase